MKRSGGNYEYCSICGREFDVRGGVRWDSSGPVCPECLSRQGVQRGPRLQFLKPGFGPAILKCAVGLVFLITSLSLGDRPSAVVGAVIGLALILWGVWPWLRLQLEKGRRSRAAAEERRRESAMLQKREKE